MEGELADGQRVLPLGGQLTCYAPLRHSEFCTLCLYHTYFEKCGQDLCAWDTGSGTDESGLGAHLPLMYMPDVHVAIGVLRVPQA